ncbi:hypothetical protein [Streptomyces sp. NPDC049040]|uniref:hypothetical protein n=1 Tax=Streptomyces sp. NPDC049040 TaxID=3365593 RepID=UPI0037150C2E
MIRRDHYLPWFRQATWVVHSGGRGGTALAVVAAQWRRPRMLPGGLVDAVGLADGDGTLRLHFGYRAQVDPDGVYDDLCQARP